MSKIEVGILGATGSVGQKFIQLLDNHPYFKVTEVAASDRSAGKKYSEAVNWFLASPIPSDVAGLTVQTCEPKMKSHLIFSALDANIAGEIETAFASN